MKTFIKVKMFNLFKKEEAKKASNLSTEKADAVVKAFEMALEKLQLENKKETKVKINIENIEQIPQTIEAQFSGMSPQEIVYFYNICKTRLDEMEQKFAKLTIFEEAAYNVIKETQEVSKMPDKLVDLLKQEVKAKVDAETSKYKKFKASVDKLKGLHDMVASYVDDANG